VFASNATAVALAGGRSCEYARLPWTPDSFRRLTPRVSGHSAFGGMGRFLAAKPVEMV